MGLCVESTTEMGEYSVEIRRESFYLRGIDAPAHDGVQEHGIFVYPDSAHAGRQGTVEILIADIQKIRAALAEVERIANQ